MKGKIRVINIFPQEDDNPVLNPDTDSKSARNPFEVKAKVKEKLQDGFDLDVDVFRSSLAEMCETIIDTLGQIPDSQSEFEVDNLSLDLVIDKSGSINVLSTVSGKMNMQSGISIKFQRKR